MWEFSRYPKQALCRLYWIKFLNQMTMKLFTSLVLSFSCLGMSAQNNADVATKRKCGTVQQAASQHDAFEQWMQTALKKDIQFANVRKAAVAYNIPIVFHIIHSGTTVSARNISQAQVNSQVAILNNDYRKLNSDFSTYVTQSAFVNAAADIEINFCAAKVDPNGTVLAEPGIDRINVTTKGWSALPYATAYIESTVKPGTIWDPTKYFNVWVLQFGGSDLGTLGYAQFPTIPSGTNPVTDMVGQGGSANTDGVVIDYRYTGNVGAATAPYNKGRTLTHETGHWLGLWHIWGDDNDCSGTDYVADTPNQEGENSSCPSAGAVKTDGCATSAPGFNYQNYMDYSDDKCMVMFTAGQKARMQAVMANCVRRTSLNNAVACVNVGIEEAQAPVNVSVFPNPTQGELTINVELMNAQDITVSVINTLGQTVKEVKQLQSNGGLIKINLSDNTQGVYFVTVKCKSGSFSKRIILQ
jgi:hypothetical protein